MMCLDYDMDIPSTSSQYLAPGPDEGEVLLSLDKKHRAYRIWIDKEFVQVVRARAKVGFDEPPVAIHEHLRTSGFYGAMRVMAKKWKLDMGLITALVERWRPECHTFHFPTGEITITLQDVSMLLGLPIDGDAIIGRPSDIPSVGDPGFDEMCMRLLGVVPQNDAGREPIVWGRRLSMTWLRAQLTLSDDPTEEEIVRYARRWILNLIGSQLLPDKSAARVSLLYLTHLERLDEQQSWGTAVLSRLYRELCKATNDEENQIGGCCILLQLWAWERLPFLAPINVSPWEGSDSDPYGCRWPERPNLPPAVPRTTEVSAMFFYRQSFDFLLNEKEVIWEPYKEVLSIDGALPQSCVRDRRFWDVVLPLLDYSVLEIHCADYQPQEALAAGLIGHVFLL